MLVFRKPWESSTRERGKWFYFPPWPMKTNPSNIEGKILVPY
uniref:Uncharacterized protein n=1 Tax=Rhizophora mucronata TaxID=61149 RepID=A0A2P2QND0_RHIMU